MPTTSEILGLSPTERAAAIFTAAGEAGPGQDKLGVLQTILMRKLLSGNQHIGKLVKAPQQFVANDPYTLQQVSDPRFGQKVYGSRYTDIANSFDDPNQMIQGLSRARGATQFRGQAALSSKHREDVMLDPKGNSYSQYNPDAANQLIQKLKGGRGQQTSSLPGGNIYNIYMDGEPDDAGQRFLSQFLFNRGQPLASSKPNIQALASAILNPQTPDFTGDDYEPVQKIWK